VLRLQLVFGFKDPGANQDAVNFLNQIFTTMKDILQCRKYSLFFKKKKIHIFHISRNFLYNVEVVNLNNLNFCIITSH